METEIALLLRTHFSKGIYSSYSINLMFFLFPFMFLLKNFIKIVNKWCVSF